MSDIVSPARARRFTNTEKVILVLIAVALALRLRLIFLLNINWDEFLYLSHVYSFDRGEISSPLQLLHVHFFGWLKFVSENEVNQVIAARLAIFLLGLFTIYFTYAVARQFFNRSTALLTILVYLSFSNVVEHGTAFRADPIGALLFVISMYAIMRWPARPSAGALAGFLMAVGVMVTIKTAIQLVAVGLLFLVLLITRENRRSVVVQVLCFTAVLSIATLAIYLGHRASASAVSAAGLTPQLSSVADKMFNLGELFPRLEESKTMFGRNSFLWGLMVAGMSLAALRAWRELGESRRKFLIYCAFLAPLLSILIYRNAFPYFYVFILSPAVVVSGVAIERILTWSQANRRAGPKAAAVAMIILTFGTFIAHYLTNDMDRVSVQRTVLAAVHQIFPEPVPYLDAISAVSSYPNVGFFMSTWGLESYKAAGQPVLAHAITARAPVFILLDKYVLVDSFVDLDVPDGLPRLVEADRRIIKENYIPHWGMIYVAGKVLQLSAGEPLTFEVVVPGTYTVEAEMPAEIDGMVVAPGKQALLTRGPHVARLPSTSGTLTLRWGSNLVRPSVPPPKEPFWVGFR